MATVLFASPHADDETLSMGSAIRKHLEAGHDVHVLLLTDGLGSGAQAVVGLDDAAFTAARDDEYMRACRRLGVRFPNIHIAPLRANGVTGLSVASAEASILTWLNGRTDVWLKSYTYKPAAGRHQDHVNAGQAALNVLNAGQVGNLRCYVEPWVKGSFPSATVETAGNSTVVKAALSEYSTKDSAGGKYGIGYISVPTYFDAANANPANYYHLP